jgi:hypothetical protein
MEGVTVKVSGLAVLLPPLKSLPQTMCAPDVRAGIVPDTMKPPVRSVSPTVARITFGIVILPVCMYTYPPILAANPVPCIVTLLPTGPRFVVGDVMVTLGTTV